MKIEARQDAGWLIARVDEARIDAAAAIAFKEAMRAITEGSTNRIILDLETVDFIDSSGLGAIVAVMKLLGQQRPLHLAALRPNVDRVFRLTRMDTIFPIHASVADALAHHGQ